MYTRDSILGTLSPGRTGCGCFGGSGPQPYGVRLGAPRSLSLRQATVGALETTRRSPFISQSRDDGSSNELIIPQLVALHNMGRKPDGLIPPTFQPNLTNLPCFPISFNTGETWTHFPTKTRSRISPSPVLIFSSLTSAELMPCYQKPPKTMRSKLFDSTRVTTHKCPLRHRTCDLWCKLTDQSVGMAGSRTYASKLWIATMPGTFAPRIALRGGRGLGRVVVPSE